MSVTAARGFTAAGVAAGIAAGGASPDLALVVNTGPGLAAAGLLTSGRVQAAPVLWTTQVLAGGQVCAAVLHSGGANADTGPAGFRDTHATAEHVAAALGQSAGEVAVAGIGPAGVRLPMNAVLPGVDAAASELSRDGGERAASAVTPPGAAPATAATARDGWCVGGMAGGGGTAEGGTVAVLTTDAALDAAELDRALRGETSATFAPPRPGTAPSAPGAVLLLASAASGVTPPFDAFAAALGDVCADLRRRLPHHHNAHPQDPDGPGEARAEPT